MASSQKQSNMTKKGAVSGPGGLLRLPPWDIRASTQDPAWGVKAFLAWLPVWVPELNLHDTPLGPTRDNNVAYNKVYLRCGPGVATGKCFLLWGRIQPSWAFQDGFIVSKTKLCPERPLLSPWRHPRSTYALWKIRDPGSANAKETSLSHFAYGALYFLGHRTSLKT